MFRVGGVFSGMLLDLGCFYSFDMVCCMRRMINYIRRCSKGF